MKKILSLLAITFLFNGCSHVKTFDPFSCDVFSDAIEPLSNLRFVTCMESEIPKTCQKYLDSGDVERQTACFGLAQLTCKKQAWNLEFDLLQKYIECIVDKAARKI